MSCEICIKDMTGRSRTVCVNSEEDLKNMTVKEFIRRFCPGEDLDNNRYIFNGRQLEGDRTLGYYDIQDCCTIHMILRKRGGALPPEDEDKDEDKGMSRTESINRLADMQQTEPESSSSCCIL